MPVGAPTRAGGAFSTILFALGVAACMSISFYFAGSRSFIVGAEAESWAFVQVEGCGLNGRPWKNGLDLHKVLKNLSRLGRKIRFSNY